MKKILTSVLAVILSALMLCSIACSTANPDTTYDGNYSSVTAQDLYTATSGVKTSVDRPSAENEKSGSSIVATYSHFVTTNEYEMNETTTFNCAIVATFENGSLKVDGSFVVTNTVETSVDNKKNTLFSVNKVFLKNNEAYFNSSISSTLDGKNEKYEIKYKTEASEFYKLYEQTMDTVYPSIEDAPTEQNEFIAFINDMTETHGLKITADTTDKIKVKAEVLDTDKFKIFASNSFGFEGFDTQIQKFGINYVFNADKTFSAFKYEHELRFISPYGINKTKSSYEEKAYAGSIIFPSDLGDYTPLYS
jgi:hypothetical protein